MTPHHAKQIAEIESTIAHLERMAVKAVKDGRSTAVQDERITALREHIQRIEAKQ